MRQYVEFSGRDMKGLCSPNKISRLAASTREAEPNCIWAPEIDASIRLAVPEKREGCERCQEELCTSAANWKRRGEEREREENEAVNARKDGKNKIVTICENTIKKMKARKAFKSQTGTV